MYGEIFKTLKQNNKIVVIIIIMMQIWSSLSSQRLRIELYRDSPRSSIGRLYAILYWKSPNRGIMLLLLSNAIEGQLVENPFIRPTRKRFRFITSIVVNLWSSFVQRTRKLLTKVLYRRGKLCSRMRAYWILNQAIWKNLYVALFINETHTHTIGIYNNYHQLHFIIVVLFIEMNFTVENSPKHSLIDGEKCMNRNIFIKKVDMNNYHWLYFI